MRLNFRTECPKSRKSLFEISLKIVAQMVKFQCFLNALDGFTYLSRCDDDNNKQEMKREREREGERGRERERE